MHSLHNLMLINFLTKDQQGNNENLNKQICIILFVFWSLSLIIDSLCVYSTSISLDKIKIGLLAIEKLMDHLVEQHTQ